MTNELNDPLKIMIVFECYLPIWKKGAQSVSVWDFDDLPQCCLTSQDNKQKGHIKPIL